MKDLARKNLPVVMVKNDLLNIPQFSLPTGFTCKWYSPGDETLWLNIHKKADNYNRITQDIFINQFRNNIRELSQRQCYVFDSEGTVAGTGTAWFNNYHNKPFGRIHWIAIVPEMQGKKLGKSLMTIVCNRLLELGHDNAYLSTSSLRLPAINLYLTVRLCP